MDDYEAGKLYKEKCIYTLKYDNVPDSIKQKYIYVTQYQVVHHKCLPDSTTYYIFENGESNWFVEASKMMNYQFQADPAGVFTIDTMDVFTSVEEMPQFPGGTQALMKFIGKKLRYPEEARDHGKSGVVWVSFIIGTDGNVIYADVLNGFDKSCEEEALRVINLLPR